MSHPRFLVNHDFNEHIVRGVLRREPAIEFKHVRDVGMETSSDAEVLEFANAEKMIILSHDVNTMSAAANDRLNKNEAIHGLLLVHQRTSLAVIIDDIILIWASSEAKEWKNEVRFLPL